MINLLPTPKRPTLKQALLSRVFSIIGFTLLAYAALVTGDKLGTLSIAPHQEGSMVEVQDRAPAKGSPSAVWAMHSDSCWQSGQQALTEELPGAAIIHYKDGRAVYTKKRALVSSAFDEVLSSIGYGEHDDARFSVIALCL